MKSGGISHVLQLSQALASAIFPGLRRMLLGGLFFCAPALPLAAATVIATYNAPSDVPVTAASYTATGNTIQISLNFPPSPGTSLTVVRNTGLNFIQGQFSNLGHGQTVVLTHGGSRYYFTANYHANSGRDLALQWMNVRPFAWGAGANGKLGNNSTADSARAVTVNASGALWGKLPSSGSAGGGHSLGLCADGTLASWGMNSNGQLGNNSTSDSSVPVLVTGGSLAGKTVAAASAGASHSLALSSEGTVFAWGLNTNGQLGDGTTTQHNAPAAITGGALAGKTIVAISAGSNHSLALSSEGIVIAWGLNTSGQVGDGSMEQRNTPVAINGGVLAGRTVVAISAGGSHSLALCSDGTLASWGLNTNGQLGDSSNNTSLTPVAVTRDTGALLGRMVIMISAGGSHSLALCSDGAIASWGSNSSGQLGNGNNIESSLPVQVSTTGVLNGKSVFSVSAGASHSVAQCYDGTVVTWGMGANGQLGNNSNLNSTVPVVVDASGLIQSGFSGVISGSSANHSLALVASPEVDLSHCGFHKQITYAQSSALDPVLEPDSPYSFHSYAGEGPMSDLLASSALTPPVGGTGIAAYEKGSNGLQIYRIFSTKGEMDVAYPTGSYMMSIQTSTPNVYQVALPLGSDNYPGTPKITGVTNATWENGGLKVTNPANPVTITWSNPYNDDTWFQIDNTEIQKSDSTPSNNFTIPGNALMNNSFYRASVNLSNSSGSTAVPGLSGVWANSNYQVRVEFTIQVGTPDSEDPPMYLLMKNHNQVQFSNIGPMDTPNFLPDADRAPFSLTAESPVGGTLSGPSGTSFPLLLHPDSDGVSYEYLSQGTDSADTLNTSHPNGTYTFPGGVSVELPDDAYPATAKVLTVNGGTPVWNAQGQLALDPTIDNTITWSAVSVPNFATEGHQSVYFESYQDFNFANIEIERGALTGDPDATAITTMTIPKFSMSPTFTYNGYIGYAKVASASEPSPGVYAVAVYESSDQFMAVALKPQTLTFGSIPAKVYPGTFTLGATASSGLPVSYEIISGPATLDGNAVTLVGTGTVTVRASQAGNGVYASAVNVTQSFVVYPSRLALFRANNALAADGSQDLLTPASDGVPNLLKFAFNMIHLTAPGSGQASSLSVPNVQTVGMTGNAGLPRQGTDSGKLTVTYVRRRSSSTPGVTYAVEFSNTMATGSWGSNDSATVAVSDIDANFERVTVTDNGVYPKRFARVRVIAN